MTEADPAARPRRSIPVADIVHDLIEGASDLSRLSKKHFPSTGPGGSVRRLAAWYDRPKTGVLLSALRRLAEDRAELVVAHARAAAARRMIELATAGENAESSRKACFDLLKLPAPGASARGTASASLRRETAAPREDPPPDPEAVRRIYDRLADENPESDGESNGETRAEKGEPS